MRGLKEPPVHPDERLGMALFLAVAVHALVILGVGITWEPGKAERNASMMEVTLAWDEAEKPPEDPDYLADIDQDGGGIAPEPQVPSPLLGSPIPSAETLEEARRAASTPQERVQAMLQSPAAETATPEAAKDAAAKEPSLEEALDRQRNEATAQAAALQRRLSQPREPSKRFINARTQAHEAARYMEAWTRKIEAVGNLNYPDEAEERGLSGQLILEVTLAPDGSLESARVVDPSHYRLLDEAALRIVRLGAPFPEIPKPVLDGNDQLVITRTWEFVDGRRLRAR